MDENFLRTEKRTVAFCQCKRCSHKWPPRNSLKKPRVCPKCKSPYWDVERQHD